VVTSFGDIDPDELTDPGLCLSLPVLRSFALYNVKTIETKETMQVPTADEMLVGLDVSVFVRLDSSQVAELRSSVTGDPLQTLLVPTLRSQTRQAAGGFKVEDFYNQEKRAQISNEIKHGIVSKMEPRGIVIEDVLIRDIVPPKAFQAAVEKKLAQKQRAEQKEFELEQAKLNREIEKVYIATEAGLPIFKQQN
jgi:regulator of protease activity HflC (stomatin/prohibitin superfamily)